MTSSRLDQLEHLLHAASQCAPASAAAEFTWRCQLLDRLDWHRAELSAVTVDGANAPIAALRDEVLASCLRLEQMNRDTAEAFRIRIATRRCIRGNLLDALQPYADSAPGDRLRYDSLDVLIAGILGIDELTGNDDVLSDAEMVRYQPTPARIALELVRRTNPQPGDVFVDIGSGLGVVPIMVALLSGASALGIEVQATYCDHARAAARRLNVPDVRFVCADARDADLSAGTLFYLFTPFRGTLLRQVVERLHVQTRQRRIRVCTYGPLLSDAAHPSWKPMPVAAEFIASPLGIYESRRDE